MLKSTKTFYRKFFLFSAFLAVHLLASDTFYYSNSKRVRLTPIDAQPPLMKSSARVVQNIKYYKTQNETVVGVSNKLIVKFSDGAKYDAVVQKYSLTLIKKMFQNTYLFETPQGVDALDLANELYDLAGVAYAHPNFLRDVQKR